MISCLLIGQTRLISQYWLNLLKRVSVDLTLKATKSVPHAPARSLNSHVLNNVNATGFANLSKDNVECYDRIHTVYGHVFLECSQEHVFCNSHCSKTIRLLLCCLSLIGR